MIIDKYRIMSTIGVLLEGEKIAHLNYIQCEEMENRKNKLKK